MIVVLRRIQSTIVLLESRSGADGFSSQVSQLSSRWFLGLVFPVGFFGWVFCWVVCCAGLRLICCKCKLVCYTFNNYNELLLLCRSYIISFWEDYHFPITGLYVARIAINKPYFHHCFVHLHQVFKQLTYFYKNDSPFHIAYAVTFFSLVAVFFTYMALFLTRGRGGCRPSDSIFGIGIV